MTFSIGAILKGICRSFSLLNRNQDISFIIVIFLISENKKSLTVYPKDILFLDKLQYILLEFFYDRQHKVVQKSE